MRNMNWRGQGGFTLMEMLLVVVIIGMLAGIAAWKFLPQMGKNRIVAAQMQVYAFKSALDTYELNNAFYPSQEQGLAALIAPPTTPPVARDWRGPYIDKQTLPKDPWGRDYVYRIPGQKNLTGYDVFSAGPNQIEGDEDDIGNW